MPDNDAFDSRLKRINASKRPSEPEGQKVAPRSPKPRTRVVEPGPLPGPEPEDESGAIATWTLAMLSLLMIPMGLFAAFVAYDLELKLPTFERSGHPVAARADRPDRNLVERLMFGEAPPFLYTYLPPAPEGWVRVTPADTQDDVQAAIAALGARYPGGESALRAHPVFQPTARFLDLANDERVTFPPLNLQIWHQAYYLHPSGAGLVAKLVVRDADKALGPSGDPAAWQAEVLRMREVHSIPGATYQNVEIGPFLGAAAIHRDTALGATLDASSAAPRRVDMNLAVGPHAIIELRGVAAGRDLPAVLAGVDPNAIAARAALQGAD